MPFDQALRLEPFSSLPREAAVEILAAARERDFSAGSQIFRQGDAGDTFCVVLTGLVSVYADGTGSERELTRLGPGECFGEMALLTGSPRSASVRAVESTRLLEISKPALERLMAASPELSLSFARLLSQRVARITTDLSATAETERAYQRLVAEQHAGARRELIGHSPSLARLRARAGELARTAGLVLIRGPVGTEKRALAWTLHQAGPHPDAPFLVLDAQAVTLSGKPAVDELERELAQACALFGLRPGALPLSGATRLGLLKAAEGGTLAIENADALAAPVEAQLAEFVRTGRYLPLGAEAACEASVRLILTATAPGAESELAGLAGESTLVLPALKQRKQDLLPLIEHLAREHGRQQGKEIDGIQAEAHAQLLAYDWPGNTEELDSVIRRAASLAQGRQLTSEDIFLDAGASSSGSVFNLLSLAGVTRVLLSRARMLSTLGGTAAFVFLLWQGWEASFGRASLVLTWTFWEPAILLGSLLAARIWCAVCPIGAAAGLLGRFGWQRAVPAWLRDGGVWAAAGGVGVILWAQAAWHMESSSRATAVLILAILLPALAAGLLFKRRAWCRYLCPLGQMIGVFSTCSATELRGNPGVCGTDCRDHRCYAGHAGKEGCPVFEGPFALRANTQCIVCFECVRACEHASPAWNLRLPGAELWSARKPVRELAILVPAILGAQFFRSLVHAGVPASWQHPLPLALLCAAWMAAFLGLARKAGGPWVGHVLVPLAAAGEFAFQTGQLLSLAGTGWTPALSPWALKSLQVLLCAGGAAAALALYRRFAESTPHFLCFLIPVLGAAQALFALLG